MATLLVAGLGVYSALNLPIDAVPDLTNVQVQVITEAPALSPLEVETLLSFPVEGAMSGLPNVEQIRSISKFGISVVTIVFQEGTDIYRARQLVGERLAARRRGDPAGLRHADARARSPRRWARSSSSRSRRPRNRASRRWSCARSSTGSSPTSCAGCPGVTEINAHGGELKTYQVELDPDKLATYRLSMTDVFDALRTNNANVGGGYLVHEGEARYIRGVSQARTRRGHRGDRDRRAQRRAGHDRRRGQGPPRADDPRRAWPPATARARSSPAW